MKPKQALALKVTKAAGHNKQEGGDRRGAWIPGSAGRLWERQSRWIRI